jgi:pyruvate kinase
MLVKMLDAGMNVARLNFSHGDHNTHSQSLDNLRAALKQRPDKTCAVMLDTKGPEVRTGLLRDNKPIEIQAGQTLKIVTDYAIEGDNTKIACSYKNLPKAVKVGSTIFIADGSLTCEVVEIQDVSAVPISFLLGPRYCEVQERSATGRKEEHEPAWRLHRPSHPDSQGRGRPD